MEAVETAITVGEMEAIEAIEADATGVIVDDFTLELSWEAPEFLPVEMPVTYVVIAAVEKVLAGQYVVVNVFVTRTVEPDALKEEDTTTFVSVVRPLDTLTLVAEKEELGGQ